MFQIAARIRDGKIVGVKFPALFFAGLFILSVGACSINAGGTNIVQSPTGGDFTENQIMEGWGWIIAHEKKLAGDEISDRELSVFEKGFLAGIRGQPAPFDLGKIYPDIERLAKARHEKVIAVLRQKNRREADSFFLKLKQQTNVLSLPENCYYEITKPGGAHPKIRQTINVHYTARLIDGTEFSQIGPVDMVLVTNREVCRGWTDMIQRMGAGGTAKLYVPPPLSENDAERFGVEPDSTMIFEIELLGFTNTSPEDLESAMMMPPPESLPQTSSAFADRDIIEAWGWVIANETHAAKFELSESGISSLEKGLAAGIKNQPCPVDAQKIYPAVERFLQNKREQMRQAEKQKRTLEMEALFAELKKNTNVVELPDGLRYEILKPGAGPSPKSNQTVKVLYTGRLINGRIFDSTEVGPLDVDLDKVIRGWSEGIQKIGKGGRIKLYIPPALGYGDEDTSGIPANSTLIFDVELLDIKNAPVVSSGS